MKWEYHVVHLNVDDTPSDNIETSNPEAASEKLKGSLSPDFLKDQFPEQFHENGNSEHPAIQLSKFLNKKGHEQWELSQTVRLGQMLFLIMKRPID
ncbi:hypothetical protein [Prochlorococcus marinus]|uniref:DUF4177 domain-containing protein n=1 Tax=Prochlorococcus marinus XMU1408 TaxID=2213228 RepID=A0A318R4A3_PROMR|nr:hypothetical protein [Prochlorococcus marinus]MBW3041869.1 hypothetical protein [Prochlorococcus marinus str. XMU1408]PYE03004.1 hypothetical protein DNJ73_04460 [Prochlorococcus marinus XMU1408]